MTRNANSPDPRSDPQEANSKRDDFRGKASPSRTKVLMVSSVIVLVLCLLASMIGVRAAGYYLSPHAQALLSGAGKKVRFVPPQGDGSQEGTLEKAWLRFNGDSFGWFDLQVTIRTGDGLTTSGACSFGLSPLEVDRVQLLE